MHPADLAVILAQGAGTQGITVFGSLARSAERPGDLDLLIDLRHEDDWRAARAARLALRLARENYGKVDPFLRTRDGLIVRNDEATGWQRAKNARAILGNATREGVPISEVVARHGDVTLDFIPDLHADHARLETTLSGLGYSLQDGVWRAAGRRAVFLGDLIDNGPDNLAVLTDVKAMTDAGQAICIMGNHELNAILYHRKGRDGNWLRSPGGRHAEQHASFLAEFGHATPEARAWTAWFLTMPLAWQGPGITAAHAFLSPRTLGLLRQASASLRLPASRMEEVAAQEGPYADAVLDVTKGPEIILPDGPYGFHDHYGHWRTAGRYRWWGEPPRAWPDAFLSPGRDLAVPADGFAPMEGKSWPLEREVLVVGHYKKKGDPGRDAANVICLDHPDEPVSLSLPAGQVPDLARMFVARHALSQEDCPCP